MKKEKYSKCSFKPMQTKKWSCFYLPKNPPFLPVLWWTTRLKPSSMLPASSTNSIIPHTSFHLPQNQKLNLLRVSHSSWWPSSNDLHNPNKSCPSPLPATTFLNPSQYLSEFSLCLSLSIANLSFCDLTSYKNFLIYTRFLDPEL